MASGCGRGARVSVQGGPKTTTRLARSELPEALFMLVYGSPQGTGASANTPATLAACIAQWYGAEPIR